MKDQTKNSSSQVALVKKDDDEVVVCGCYSHVVTEPF